MEIRRKPVSFRMRADYCEKLKFIAKLNHVAVSDVILAIILRYIENYEKLYGSILLEDSQINKW